MHPLAVHGFGGKLFFGPGKNDRNIDDHVFVTYEFPGKNYANDKNDIVVMTYSSSWADAFDELTSNGVHVRTYSPDSSLYIHAKVMLIDYGYPNHNAFLGSENFSTDSLTQNRELGQTTQNTTALLGLNNALASDARGGTLWTKTSASTHRKSH